MNRKCQALSFMAIIEKVLTRPYKCHAKISREKHFSSPPISCHKTVTIANAI